MDIESTGKFSDAIVGATCDVAGRAAIVVGSGQAAGRVEVPGETVVRLGPPGPHIVLSELTRDVRPGETVIVTLLFEKVGRIGVPTRVE
jgi:copper(I)-binding protein